jgi:hypothetical protein
MATSPGGTIELLARHANSSATADDAVKWAIDALVDGFDSPSLRQLAGLNSPTAWFEAMPLFERTLNELQLEIPRSKNEILRLYLRSVAESIVSGVRSPSVALAVIHREVLGPLNHPPDLMPWCYLWEGLEPVTFASLDDAAIASAVRALARDTLAGSTA